jgi:hypothetical protein
VTIVILVILITAVPVAEVTKNVRGYFSYAMNNETVNDAMNKGCIYPIHEELCGIEYDDNLD